MNYRAICVTAAGLALTVFTLGVLQAQMTQPRDTPQMHGHQHGQAGDVQQHARLFEGIDRAVAVLTPTEGNEAHGVVVFEKISDGQVRVTYRVQGLEPGGTHGFHVHEYGDLTSDDGTSLGGHYNPEGHPHELPHQHPRHAGDLGNIEADQQGVAAGSITVDTMTIAGLKNPILGRGLVVHAQRDTGEGESGEAGARIGVGVIGVAQPQSE